MIARLLPYFVAIFIALTPTSARSAALLCDISPAPVECWAQRKIATAYSGHALDVFNPYSGATGNIGFLADGSLDNTALDVVVGSSIALGLTWKGQKNGCDLSSTVVTRTGTISSGSTTVTINTTGITAPIDIMGTGVPEGTIAATIDSPTQLTMNIAATGTGSVSLTFSQSPNIRDLVVGNSRSLEFQGINHSGAIFGLTSCDITARGVTAKDWSALFVLRPYSSMNINQAGGFDSGAVVDLQGSGGTVAQVLNDPNNGTIGGWRVKDGASLNWLSEMPVQSGDIVLVISSRSGESVVRIWQNGRLRSTGTVSGLTRTATTMYLGKLLASVPGNFSQAGGMGIVAALLWNVGLTTVEASRFSAAAALAFNVKIGTGNYRTNAIYGLGDSVTAGYVAFGLWSMFDELSVQLTYPSWVSNYGIPGSTVTTPGSGCAYTQCLYSAAVAPEIPSPVTTLARIPVIVAGGNDAGFSPTCFTAPSTDICQSGTTDGTTNVITAINDTTPLVAGTFVYAGNISQLCVVKTKTLHTITIVLASDNVTACIPSTAGVQGLQYTTSTVTPASVANAVLGIANQALLDGATSAVYSTVLPRNVNYQPWITAFNTYIRAASPVANRYLCDLAADAQLSVNPGPMYADASHMSDAGQKRAGVVLAGCVNPLLIAPRRRRVDRSRFRGYKNLRQGDFRTRRRKYESHSRRRDHASLHLAA